MRDRRQPVTLHDCKGCGGPITRRPTESPSHYNRRRFCDKACAARTLKPSEARRRTPKPDVIDEVEWLLGTDHPDRIAVRLGYAHAGSLGRALESWGRQDLARHFAKSEVAA